MGADGVGVGEDVDCVAVGCFVAVGEIGVEGVGVMELLGLGCDLFVVIVCCQALDVTVFVICDGVGI